MFADGFWYGEGESRVLVLYEWVRSDVSRMVTAGRFDLGIVNIRRTGFVTTLSRLICVV